MLAIYRNRDFRKVISKNLLGAKVTETFDLLYAKAFVNLVQEGVDGSHIFPRSFKVGGWSSVLKLLV